jgi:hypothetical protein
MTVVLLSKYIATQAQKFGEQHLPRAERGVG